MRKVANPIRLPASVLEARTSDRVRGKCRGNKKYKTGGGCGGKVRELYLLP